MSDKEMHAIEMNDKGMHAIEMNYIEMRWIIYEYG
jgi:hypothetical protein